MGNKNDHITYFGYNDNNANACNIIKEDNFLGFALHKIHNEKIGGCFGVGLKKKSNEFFIKDNIEDLRDNIMLNIRDPELVYYFWDSFDEAENESIKIELVNKQSL